MAVSSEQVLGGILLASPFLIVRNVYGILEVVFEYVVNTAWNPVTGSVVAFVLMALLMEYVVIGIYMYVGYSMPPDRGLARDVPDGAAAGKYGEETAGSQA